MKHNLKEKSILITRASHQSKTLKEMAERNNAKPILMPMIQLNEVKDKTNFDLALNKLDEIDWIVFTSENAVEFFFNYVNEKGVKFYFYPELKIATVGETTKLKLEQFGFRTNFVPIKYTAEVLAENMDEDILGKKVLIPRSDLANNDYVKVFERRGASVFSLTVYENTPIEYSEKEISDILNHGIDYLTFTSGSTIKAFDACLKKAKIELNQNKLYCIGPSTAKVATSLGYLVGGIADPHTEEGLFDLIIKDNSHV